MANMQYASLTRGDGCPWTHMLSQKPTTISVECGSDHVEGHRLVDPLLIGIVQNTIELKRPVHDLIVDDALLWVPIAVNINRLQHVDISSSCKLCIINTHTN